MALVLLGWEVVGPCWGNSNTGAGAGAGAGGAGTGAVADSTTRRGGFIGFSDNFSSGGRHGAVTVGWCYRAAVFIVAAAGSRTNYLCLLLGGIVLTM